MVGTIWYCGGSVDVGRLIDDTDPAYGLMVHGAFRQLLRLKEVEAARTNPGQSAP